MCYIACEVCGAEEFSGPCLRCAHIKDKFKEMREEIRDKDRKIERIHDAVLFILSSKTKEILNQEHIKIETQLLKDLWNAVELRYYNSKTARDFLHERMIDLAMLADAFSLFRKKCNRTNRETMLKRLESLYKVCENAEKARNWTPSLDMTPLELIEQIKLENE
jgi:hypothetical protein